MPLSTARVDKGSVETARVAPGRSRWVDGLFVALLAADIAIRLMGATALPRYDAGDLLAPFSIVDQLLHGPPPDAGRQQLLLPALIAGLAWIFGIENDISALLRFCHGVTAVFSSLCLVPVYLFARRLLSPKHGLAAAVLLAVNAPFHFESYYFNPTQAYAFLLTLSFYWIIVPRRRAQLLAGLFAGLAWCVRHEGIVLFVLLLVDSISRRRPERAVAVRFGAPLLALATASAAWGARLLFTDNPWAFLQNTAATDSWWAIFEYAWRDFGLLVLSVSNLIIERTGTLVVIHTLVGIALIPLGAAYLAKSNRRAALGLAHLALYHGMIAIYLLALPVTSERYLAIQWGTVLKAYARYYHAWTPILVVFVYAGLWSLLGRLIQHPGARKAALALCVLVFGVQQLSSLSFSYRALFLDQTAPDSQVLDLAQYFRDQGLKDRHIVYARQADGELVAWPWAADRQRYPHPVWLSVLTGHNNVNCWDFDLSKPNIDCTGRYGKLLVSELEEREKIDYILISTASGLAARCGEPVFENRRFHLYQARSAE